MSFVCYCCKKSFPPIYRNVHHVIPKSVGGSDNANNLVELCPGCHDALHAVAHKLCNKNSSPSRIADQLGIIFKENRDAINTCYSLASHVRDAIITASEKEKDPYSKASVQFTIPYKYKKYLILAAKEARISQEEYMRRILLHHLKKVFNQLAQVEIGKELDTWRRM